MTAPAPAAAEGRTLEDRNALVLSCVPLAAALVRRLAYPSGGTPPRGLPPFADVLQEAFLALVRAADLYDPSRAKFSTYAHWAVLNRVLGLLRDARAHPPPGRLPDDAADWTPAPGPDPTRPDARTLARLDAALASLPPRERAVVEDRHLRGRRAKDIARDLGVSKQLVSKLDGRGLALLRRALLEDES